MLIVLDGKKMTDKKKMHSYLKERFKLESYYGSNLDAFWDILSSRNDELSIILLNKEDMISYLGQYGYSFIKVLEELEEFNSNIKLEVIE